VLILLVGAPRFELGTPSPPDCEHTTAAAQPQGAPLVAVVVMVVMTPPYGVNPAVDVSLAAGIVSVAENEPPTFLKPIDIFDAAPDIDKAFFLRAKLGSPRRGKGSRSSLHFSFRQQDNAGVSDLHAIKIIQVAVVGPFDLDFIAEIVGWQVSYIHEGQMSDDIGLVLHDVNAERITLTYARRRILASLIWRRAMQARMTVKAAMKNVATARISLWKVLIVFQKSFKVTKITSGIGHHPRSARRACLRSKYQLAEPSREFRGVA
jgi:hypothetical protein